MLATWTEVAPFAASAVRLTEAASSGHRSPIRTSGFAVLVVFMRRVAEGPAPRRTTPLLIVMGWSPFTRKSPAESRTTWPAGQASMAAWMPAVASAEPLP